jgi:iron complex outermembrane receptor protein
MFSHFLIAVALQAVQAPSREPEEVVVRSARDQALSDTTVSSSALLGTEIERTAPTHPNELFSRVAGAWITRGSGQESLPALRSPVLTGAGACGAFQVLEDHVPIRPAGFCNVNDLFELNLAQASQVSVYRGPGVVAEGANALHGVISAVSVRPAPQNAFVAHLEAGTDAYYRAGFRVQRQAVAAALNATDAGSFRDDEHYRHAQLNVSALGHVGDADTLSTLAWVNLDQDTAGYILGRDAYRDEALRTQNLNPEAYRKASALRLTSTFTWLSGHSAIDWTIYARSSDMDFLQHFLPGKPLERNGQDSVGTRWSWHFAASWSAGLDAEWARGYLVEYQADPLTTGSPFLQATRPQGFHYDYEVRSLALAGWGQYSANISNNLSFTAGLRYEFLGFDYDNRMLDGNTRDDGTPCGFGGCLYTRPSDRNDDFSAWAPEIGLRVDLGNDRSLNARLSRGFRPPQATELYRLQSGQTVSDLDVTTLDAIELGIEQARNRSRLSATAFHMRKSHVIFRDASGFNVSDGETRHTGLEAEWAWNASESVTLSGNLTWARHTYAFDRLAGGGEVIRNGNRVDTAPDWLGSARLQWRPSERGWVEAEWVYTGAHSVDAANEHRYGGHDLVNLRASIDLRDGYGRLGLRVSNVLDARYAERADFAFGNYRYFPGAGRRLFLSWQKDI